jgi:hypothetical protein|eukprot:SAG31_NODE_32845_length_351_cov_0.607143_1_plen_50_part_10
MQQGQLPEGAANRGADANGWLPVYAFQARFPQIHGRCGEAAMAWPDGYMP